MTVSVPSNIIEYLITIGHRGALCENRVPEPGMVSICRTSFTSFAIYFIREARVVGFIPRIAATPSRPVHLEFYRVLFDARATNSSNLESKSFRMGDSFDFL